MAGSNPLDGPGARWSRKRVIVTVPHGYTESDRVQADPRPGDWICELLTLQSTVESAADTVITECSDRHGG